MPGACCLAGTSQAEKPSLLRGQHQGYQGQDCELDGHGRAQRTGAKVRRCIDELSPQLSRMGDHLREHLSSLGASRSTMPCVRI